MTCLKHNTRWKVLFAVVAIVAANAASVATVTGVSYAQSDMMMHDYSSDMMMSK